MISQELFLSSQRQTKVRIANLDMNGSEKKLMVVERNTISEALSAAIKLQFAKDEMDLMFSQLKISEEIFNIMKIRSEKGLNSPMEADLAETEKLKAFKNYQTSVRNYNKFKIDLTVMMGVNYNSSLEIIDTFNDPIYERIVPEEILTYALNNRPEVDFHEYNIKSNFNRLELIHKEKIPNPIISAYVQRDGFNENVMGGRVSFPIRAFRDQSGEIHEGKYKLEQSKSQSEVNRHTISLEVLKAINDYEYLKIELESFPPELVKKTEKNIENLRLALQRGQINLRDALIMQQSFLNVKLNLISIKMYFALSGIELLRASGKPILEFEEVK